MNTASSIVNKFVQLVVNPAIGVIFALGLLLFVFGLVEFLRDLSQGADTKRGKDHMLWGVVGMFVMVSVFGILNLLNAVFGLGLGPGGTYTPNMNNFNYLTSHTFGN